ncbi:MAG: heme exporter protein CcmD [Porticoccaceae bacterium]|nr:heme exporter protein CcmD [Porticoccaceae bacterium]
MDLGPHAAFIWTSYGIVAFVLLALVAWLVIDGRILERRLADFAARGVTRRSARKSAESGS